MKAAVLVAPVFFGSGTVTLPVSLGKCAVFKYLHGVEVVQGGCVGVGGVGVQHVS